MRIRDAGTPFNDRVHGFRLTLPPGYTTLATEKDVDRGVAAAGKSLAWTPVEIASLRGTLPFPGLYSINFRSAGTVSVLAQRAAGNSTEQLRKALPVIKRAWESQHATNIKIAKSPVGGRPGYRLQFTLKVSGRTVTAVVLYAVANETLYTVVVSGSPYRPADVALVSRSLQFTAQRS